MGASGGGPMPGDRGARPSGATGPSRPGGRPHGGPTSRRPAARMSAFSARQTAAWRLGARRFPAVLLFSIQRNDGARGHSLRACSAVISATRHEFFDPVSGASAARAQRKSERERHVGHDDEHRSAIVCGLEPGSANPAQPVSFPPRSRPPSTYRLNQYEKRTRKISSGPAVNSRPMSRLGENSPGLDKSCRFSVQTR